MAAPAPIFTAENTARLLAIPFSAAAVYTDCADLALDEKEVRELAGTGSACLNEFVQVDSKWVALSLFSVSLIGVVAQKFVTLELFKRQVAFEQWRARQGGGTAQPAAAAPAPQPRVTSPALNAGTPPGPRPVEVTTGVEVDTSRMAPIPEVAPGPALTGKPVTVDLTGQPAAAREVFAELPTPSGARV